MRIIKPVDPVYKMYKEHTGLIGRCLRGLKVPQYCDFEDLEQAGRIGLIQAIERFNPEKNVQFSTYAYYYVRGSIMRELIKNISMLSSFGINKYVRKKEIDAPAVVSLTVEDEEDNNYLQSLIQDNENNTYELDITLDYYNLRKLFNKYFGELTIQQKTALELYYFTANKNGKYRSYNDVAKEMNISPERVRQLLNKGKNILKKKFGKYLDVYV